MFESRLELFGRQFQLEGEIEWATDDREPVLFRRVLFAYAWDSERGGPAELKVGVASNLAQIDRLARELVPPPPADSAWDELLEAIGRNMDEYGYDAPAALLFSAPDELLQGIQMYLRDAGFLDLQDAMDDEEIAALLFSFQQYELEGLEVGFADGAPS